MLLRARDSIRQGWKTPDAHSLSPLRTMALLPQHPEPGSPQFRADGVRGCWRGHVAREGSVASEVMAVRIVTWEGDGSWWLHAFPGLTDVAGWPLGRLAAFSVS